MKTVYDVKKALDNDLFVNMVTDIQRSKSPVYPASRSPRSPRKPSPQRNAWGEVFPSAKCVSFVTFRK